MSEHKAKDDPVMDSSYDVNVSQTNPLNSKKEQFKTEFQNYRKTLTKKRTQGNVPEPKLDPRISAAIKHSPTAASLTQHRETIPRCLSRDSKESAQGNSFS